MLDFYYWPSSLQQLQLYFFFFGRKSVLYVHVEHKRELVSIGASFILAVFKLDDGGSSFRVYHPIQRKVSSTELAACHTWQAHHHPLGLQLSVLAAS